MLIIIALTAIVMLMPAYSSAANFAEWLTELRAEAISRGISEATLNAAFEGVQPIPRVIELDRNQPEFKKTFNQYLKMTVSEWRIKKGRKMLQQHRELLEDVSRQYGVQPRFLAAIWGMETNYGKHTGGFSVIASLATLAHDTRRSSFFRKELLHALTIIDEGHISAKDMNGSWAGAMGQLQFMPSTFTGYAVDADKDGRKDIWNTLPDIFASAASYLAKNWQPNRIWGREVQLPPDFDYSIAGLKTKMDLSEWQSLGVRRINGDALPEVVIDASLIMPSGDSGPAFLVYENFRAIYRWNRSYLYSLAVCRLSDILEE